MAEENLLPAPIVVNIVNTNQSEDEHGNSGELVEPISIETPGIGDDNSELVSDTPPSTEPTGPDGSIQFSDATGSTSPIGDAIEIAGIEAERDITIAALDAETERARIAASAATSQELELCQTRLTTLETELAEIKNLLIPQPQLVEPIMEEIQEPETEQLETPSEPSTTNAFTSVPTVETSPALSEIEKVVDADLAKLKPKFIPI